MLENISISGTNYKVEKSFQKYVEKRIGKLDKYIPREKRKDTIVKVVVAEVNREHGNKYEITVNFEIPGGKVLVAKDETTNVFAGVDIVEAKMQGQLRRFKTENSNANYDKKGFLKRFFKK